MTENSTNQVKAGGLIRSARTTIANRRARRGSAALGIVGALTVAAVAMPVRADARVDSRAASRVDAASVVTAGSAAREGVASSLLDSLRGRSRKLRARFVAPTRSANIPILATLFGDTAVSRAGVYATADSAAGEFHFITMRPFSDKVAGRIGAYRIGFFPGERRTRDGAYGNPDGFLEVTASNRTTAISEHFRLGDFLTKDQLDVWPKYLVLREPLVDKLELVIDELRTMGVKVDRLRVMSGFRTPQYNQQGVGAGGRAQDSRHQYGDAADVYVVNGQNDWMSDLNGDGRVNTGDARVLAMAAERVEQKNPDLIGGIGIYKATSAHGPFVHIDVRGQRARWGE